MANLRKKNEQMADAGFNIILYYVQFKFSITIRLMYMG